MGIFDVVVVIVALISALHGFRVGAVAQVVTIVGFLAGLSLGVIAILNIDNHVSSSLMKSLIALVLLVLPASVLGGLARSAGVGLSFVVRRVHLGLFDRALGTVIALAGALIVCWLFSSILVNTSSAALSQAIGQSRIMREVQNVMPPVPDGFAAVDRYLANSGFPQVLVNALPESLSPVERPNGTALARVAERAKSSTVEVLALGCGDESEGSGFATTNGLIVTNAHVVAGSTAISVTTTAGQRARARLIYFDKDFDLAILRAPSLRLPGLVVDPNYVERATPAVVLGYPEGGPFDAKPAGIATRFVAQGRDIYDSSLTTRVVYQIEADIRPGNSGGPMLSLSDHVIGVVFSRSSSTTGIGYALSSPGVVRRLQFAMKDAQPVSSGACLS